MLDREEKNLSSILEKVVDALVDKGEILAGDRDTVLQALMHKQRYTQFTIQIKSSCLEIESTKEISKYQLNRDQSILEALYLSAVSQWRASL